MCYSRTRSSDGAPACAPLPRLSLLRSALLSVVAGLCVATGSAKSWKPVAPQDLSATQSQTAPGADLEYLSVTYAVISSEPGSAADQQRGEQASVWLEHHVRAKIYTQKGCDMQSILKFTYDPAARVRDVAARVVKPSGKAVELSSKDMFETTAFKKGGTEERVMSFAFPTLEPGDIVEFQYERSLEASDYSFMTFDCQMEAPVREFNLEVINSESDWRALWFNLKNAEVRRGRGVTFRNLPAFKAEDNMPAQRDFSGWLVCVFSHPYFRNQAPAEVWQEVGEYYAEQFRLHTKLNDDIKAKATALVADAATPEDKLSRLYNFCQEEISNMDWFATAELIAAQAKRDKKEYPQTARETLQLKTGNTIDINILFGALARAAGFDVRTAMHANREVLGEVGSAHGWLFMNRRSIAVKVGETWKFYSPGHYIVPAGYLSVRDVPVTAWICDEEKSFFQGTRAGAASDSPVNRKGRFTVDEEGTLEGIVEVAHHGHPGVELKLRWWGKPTQERDDFEREAITKRIPGAEVSDLSWENIGSRELPVIQRYKIRVPGYAELAGSRLILNPCYFQAGAPARFTGETRQFPVVFDYALRESDDIEIVLPDGYKIDAASAPVNVADPNGIIMAKYEIRYRGKARTLLYKREMSLGGTGQIAFQAASYGVLRDLLSRIGRSDDHRIVFKPKSSDSTGMAAPAEGTQTSAD